MFTQFEGLHSQILHNLKLDLEYLYCLACGKAMIAHLQRATHSEMFMTGVLCCEPGEFTLQDGEDWEFWGKLSWLEIAKAIFVQASVLRKDYVWNTNKCKKRDSPPFKRLCENAMWYHEKHSALPSSLQDLREALG